MSVKLRRQYGNHGYNTGQKYNRGVIRTQIHPILKIIGHNMDIIQQKNYLKFNIDFKLKKGIYV